MKLRQRLSAWNAGMFGFGEERARGRSCMMISAVFEHMISSLSTGVFYTSFLMINGIDLVNIGIIAFVPYIANCFSIFSPSILERFKKRKGVLAAARIAVHTLNLLGITVLPNFVHDPGARVAWFVVLVFLSNIINGLFSSGYSVWQVNFIPENVRADFFSIRIFVQSLVGNIFALCSSILADALIGSAYEQTVIIAFRYLAYGLGLLDVLILSLPKEYPYAQTTAKPRLRDIVVKPFRHKKFVLTVGIVFIYTFCNNVPAGSLNYYLLNNIGIAYTFIYFISVLYPLFLAFGLPLWKRLIGRVGWFKTFAISELTLFPTYVMYAFVTRNNYLWLWFALRLMQHLFGIGAGVSNANMLYINLPKEDQTNYSAFHTLATNIAAFLGMMAGTGFIAAFPDLALPFAGMEFTNVQVLLLVQAFGALLVPLAIFKFLPKLTPDEA